MTSGHKESAVSFLKMAGAGQVHEAFDRFVSSTFIHHNQYFKGDRQSLLEAMKQAHQASPNKSIDIKKVLEDGQTVMTLSKVTRRPEEPEIAVVHIFRFESGKIAEMWDLGQMIDKNSPNENGVI